MRLSDVAWAEVRRAYEAGGEELAELAARFGVRPRTIRDRARREAWTGSTLKSRPARPEGSTHDKDLTSMRGERRGLRPAARPSREEQEALLARLYRAITWKLEDMEARMTSGDMRSAQDEEREARALGNLISNFEKVTDVVLDFDKSSRSGGRGGERAPGSPKPDADDMRREIAERLERLHRGRNAAHDPRGS